jgi:hypothetical protein
VTVFMVSDFKFEQPHKDELIRRGLSEGVIAELQSELEVLKSFETTQPASRRQMREQAKALTAAFKAAEQAIEETNAWTMSNLAPYAEQYLRGQQPATRVDELKNALAAYGYAADRMTRVLDKAPGPKRGPTNEYALRVASVVRTVLERASIALNDSKKGTLAQVISIAFDALGIAKGEPEDYAAKVLARPR